ncbi:MAG: desulfoferrodoxin [Candidatus Moranbacteria bacterium RIFOXYB1_FULL_43_19]|nr:MAG: desulfoferrodoxin [Candidatus Moranbacteria bacterium RIFOXYB1_FULL_43_19]OGI28261.1 MAG: desulfoferrodoxin [Candidatus Moranbacteria bacterium RIFOXYA1_FULL_44_7]OGI32552.1 MAG: desulfoferrodoxin [Candidatus Moranbacteria bacterium RIFOXYC1_FULL_44_13]OGI38187.1 MAG: desulfoferrodoxin [Candidatus Moranbacteria bacterium RIFOXYD1_FULL_44_12]
MTELNQIYKCAKCENIIEVLHAGEGELVCCGGPMELLTEKNQEEGLTEKHLPVVEKTENGYKVKIGSVPHPMEEAHYIEWIEILADDKVYRKFLNPGNQPEAEFCVEAENITVREYCNLHGLWKA